MELAIVQNPHVKDPKKLWRLFNNAEPRKRSEEFDSAGFEAFKLELSKNPKFKVVDK